MYGGGCGCSSSDFGGGLGGGAPRKGKSPYTRSKQKVHVPGYGERCVYHNKNGEKYIKRNNRYVKLTVALNRSR